MNRIEKLKVDLETAFNLINFSPRALGFVNIVKEEDIRDMGKTLAQILNQIKDKSAEEAWATLRANKSTFFDLIHKMDIKVREQYRGFFYQDDFMEAIEEEEDEEDEDEYDEFGELAIVNSWAIALNIRIERIKDRLGII